MLMHLFYSTAINDNLITLPESESRHCVKVMRMKAGDHVKVTDGLGHIFNGVIQISHEKSTVVEITESSNHTLPSHQLHLYVGITKHADRLEWMLEKSVEFGIQSITPVISKRTEKKNIRTDRLSTIALTAMKQSLHAWLTVVHEPITFETAITQPLEGTKLIGYCGNEISRTPINRIQPLEHSFVFIGPEGDFTFEEVELAINNGFTCVDLGPSRLRTETAGLLVSSWMYLYNLQAK